MKELNKKEFNINGVLFQIYTDNVEEVEKYFRQFVVPSHEEVISTYHIYFDDDPDILSALISTFDKSTSKMIPTFKNQFHFQNGNQYLIDTEEYLCIKSNDHNYKLFGTIKGLSWIIRELLIREMEDNHYFYMHGTGIQIDDKGILLLGNSGSGKTTFMTKLNELDIPEALVSNDRVFVKNRMMHYFPIPVIYAMGTARSNNRLDDYFKRTNALTIRRGKNYATCLDQQKCDVPLTDISLIFPHIKNIDKSSIDLIIFPRIAETEQCSYLSKEEAKRRLEETNFTPDDRECERKEWLRPRKISLKEIERGKEKLHEDLIEHVPIVEMNYTIHSSSLDLAKVLRKVL